MKIESTKMPSNQDFSMSISGAFQMAKSKARELSESKILIMLSWESFLPEDLRSMRLRNGSSIKAVRTKQELSMEDLSEYSFFVYGPQSLPEYFSTINNQ